MTSNVVGEFPSVLNRRMIRSVRNPLDKATIVSIYPKNINETKETIYPGQFSISGGNITSPGITVVNPSSWWKDIDIDQPVIEIPIAANVIADSIITDWCNGMLGCDMSDSKPGLFFINGEVSKADVLSEYETQLTSAKAKQDNWFQNLIRLASSLWARGNGNPLMIWDEMRLAARELGQDGLPWMVMENNLALTPCFACGTLRNPEYPICPNCKAIDSKHPKAADIKIAAN